jgi:hypothetical protein
VGEIGVPGENHKHIASSWQTWSCNIASNTLPRVRESNSQLTDCTYSCKFNIHIIFPWKFIVSHVHKANIFWNTWFTERTVSFLKTKWTIHIFTICLKSLVTNLEDETEALTVAE